MAASFEFKENNVKYSLTWHIGSNVDHIMKRIKFLTGVQVDGDEAQCIYGIDFQFENKFSHLLTGNEARLYLLLMHEKWKSFQAYVDMEKRINTLLQGDSNPTSN